MSLSDEVRDRLADVVQLQPTKNSELQDRWELESGSDVHQYLEDELSEYYYRDDNSLIRATPEAAELVDVEPGIESDPEDGSVPSKVSVTPLQQTILSALPGPDERSASVVSVLQNVREHSDFDPDVEAIRSGIQRLRRLSVVDVEYRTVPTFRLAVDRDEFDVTVTE